MKTSEELIGYLENELDTLSVDKLDIKENDTKKEIEYKNIQQGKYIAYKKMIALLNDNNHHNLKYKGKKNNKEDDRRPIVVCK